MKINQIKDKNGNLRDIEDKNAIHKQNLKAKTDEDKEVAVDENGKAWYKGSNGGGGGGGESPYYNPNKVSLFGFTPDSSKNTFSLIGTPTDPLEVDWGDGTKETITSAVTHTYTEPFKDTLIVVKGKITNIYANRKLNYISLGENNVTRMDGMFNYCSSLTTIPALNTSNVTSMYDMFYGCSSLTTIPALNTSNVTDMDNMFYECNKLVEINMYNINTNLDIHWSTEMQQPALHKVIDNLLPQTETKTLTLGATLLERVSEEYKQKASAKGWTLA